MKKVSHVNLTFGGEEWFPRFIVGINQKLCTQCSFCLKVCPGEVFIRTAKGTIEPKNFQKCIGCGVCEKMCKENAIKCAKFEEIDRR